MVAHQIERRGLLELRLLSAFRSVPRHLFVPQDVQDYAYDDCPLPIGEGQTISQPYIVALMTSLLHLQGCETVLEIGTGSGYQAAILAQLCEMVHTIERHPVLADRARQTINSLGITNILVHTADGSLGWEDGAPYQGILVTAAAPAPPAPLLAQLADAGRLVVPLGGRGAQELEVWERAGAEFTREQVLPVVFVPMRGFHGWQEDDWPEGLH